jgi:glyoxylase-like metal-dependent hydrolase (beta-lactamase superfamily II)/8-oxo-dGTP pyrophosphatase MutT (NUDIX family)
MPTTKTVLARPAATVLLLRDTAAGPEVLLLRRAQAAALFGGAYVFPGGALDAEDAGSASLARVTGLTDAAASARLGIAAGGLAHWMAAARECFEEAGILIAQDSRGAPPGDARLAAIGLQRDAINQGASFAALLAAHELFVPGDAIVYLDHWITPPVRPRRYDTRFFIARAPHGQEGSHDNAETTHSVWLPPREALRQADRKEIEMAFATRAIVADLLPFATVDEALAAARAKTVIETSRPAVAQGSRGEQIFRPGDAPYHEIHWVDPGETMQASYEIVPGVPCRLDSLVTRITAPNPGMMTGPGTNTYLVGTDALAVIDPGPLIDAHVDAILAAGAGRIRWIVCTHTHRDHSPAAAAIKAATGATLVGYPPPAGSTQDATFAPDMQPRHGELLELGDVALRVLHTPGHASNHLCYLVESTRMLFTGDHVMQGSTVVINPPDGDMGAYLRSLEALLGLDVAIIAPGHGYLIGAPRREMYRLIAHRLQREAKVLAAVEQHGPATVDALVPAVYADVLPKLWPAAGRSLLAHLQKLAAEGRVIEQDGRFRRSTA